MQPTNQPPFPELARIRARLTTHSAQQSIAGHPLQWLAHVAELALALTCAAPAIMLAVHVAIGGAV